MDDASSVGLVEEILEQQSAQQLKLSHIDEAISDLKLSLQRLADSTAMLQMNQGLVPVAAPSHDHAFDALERDTQALRSRLSLVLGLMFLQTLILGALVLFALRPMSGAASSTPATVEAPKPAAVVAPAPAPAPVPVEAAEEEKPAEKVEKPGKKKKKH
jgi:hypothetical protein